MFDEFYPDLFASLDFIEGIFSEKPVNVVDQCCITKIVGRVRGGIGVILGVVFGESEKVHLEENCSALHSLRCSLCKKLLPLFSTATTTILLLMLFTFS